jgi:hypothetical protein
MNEYLVQYDEVITKTKTVFAVSADEAEHKAHCCTDELNAEILSYDYRNYVVKEPYRVYANMTTTLYTDVYAETADDAIALAKAVDGGSYIPCTNGESWTVQDAEYTNAFAEDK